MNIFYKQMMESFEKDFQNEFSTLDNVEIDFLEDNSTYTIEELTNIDKITSEYFATSIIFIVLSITLPDLNSIIAL